MLLASKALQGKNGIPDRDKNANVCWNTTGQGWTNVGPALKQQWANIGLICDLALCC